MRVFHWKAARRSVLALLLLLQASMAHALSTACSTLNANSGTTSYNRTFTSSEFASGESINFSYSDNGLGVGGSAMASDLVNLRSSNLGTVYSDYRSYTGNAGPYTANVSASQLAAGGLFVRITAGTYISPVSISCTGAVTADASLSSLALSAGTLSPAFAAATTSYTATVGNGTTSLTVRPTTTASDSTVTVNGGTVASGTDSGAIALAVGANTVMVVATAADGQTTKSYAINVTRAEPAPTAGNTSATVAANSSGNAITLPISGTVNSVAVASGASHGTVTASGTSITYTPVAGYSGSDSFTYTATNTSGTSAAATVTLTVSPPTLVVTPASATLPSGQVGTGYNQLISSSGGTAPYTFSASNLPPGVSLAAATGTLAGTPTAAGTFTLSITARDANNATGSASYTLTIAPQAAVAGAVSATVAANSSNNSIALNVSGGTADSAAIASTPAHGSAAVSGLAILYTPTPGFTGTDSLTYTVSNSAGTSSPATVTLTVAAAPLALSPSAGALPAGRVGVAYSQALGATGGTAPYHFSSTSLPSGLNIDASTGQISGTPTATGTFSFSATATDSLNNSGSASYTLTITEAVPVVAPASVTVGANTSNNPVALSLSGGAAAAVSVISGPSHGTAQATGTSIRYTPATGYTGIDSFSYNAANASGTSGTATVTVTVTAPALTLSPAAGALSVATVGTAYTQVFSATGGVPPYRFSAAGLPAGLSLDAATGTLSGTPATAANATLSVIATDATNAQASNTYSLAISGATPKAADATLTVTAGQSVTLDLSTGASGGPFTSATLLDVPARDMGTSSLNRLQFNFTAAAKASGTLALRFTLANAAGTSQPAILRVQINARPDPGQDQDVVGLLNAQAQSAQQFAKAQISNFTDRLEQLHGAEGHRNAFNLRFNLAQAQAARRGNPADLAPDTADPLSALQSNSPAQPPLLKAAEGEPQRARSDNDIALWTGGYVDFGDTQRSGSKVSNTTIGVSSGADLRLSKELTIGAGFGYGRDKSDIGSEGSTSRGASYSAAVYGSYHPGAVFLDALLGYSRMSFDSDRYITAANRYSRGTRDGDQLFGSVSTGYEVRGEQWLVSPYGRIDTSTTWLRAYRESGAGEQDLQYDDQRLSLLSAVTGLRAQQGIPLGWSYMNLRSRLEYSHTFNADGTSRLGYVDAGDYAYSARTEGFGQDTVSISLGIDFLWASGLTTGIGYQGTRALGEDSRSDSLSVRAAYRF